MLEGFEPLTVETGGAVIHAVRRGEGPPLLLLHGYPQTLAMWHRVAPRLAETFTVVAADLRGYGNSSKPDGGPDHAGYSKRAMAQDQVELMRHLGFDAFFVAGHDRGGRVGHRMALDHPERVRKLAVLDIVPTRTMFAQVNQYLATVYWHWFFLIQPFDLPERMIGADPEFFVRNFFSRLGSGALAPEAVAEYVRAFRDPAVIHASCEDYRAAASIDLEHDSAGLSSKVTCPLLAVWGAKGRIAQMFDVLAAWRERATDVSGRALDCGHYLPEEAPDETLRELLGFFEGS
ncbi:MAG: alpha/beta fold hydrolase [Myxococcales bacterium]